MVKKSSQFLYILIVILILQSGWVCVSFLFEITDSDQTIQWLALKNYSAGLIHEPYYYGQNYNMMLEAWLAIPFYKMGLPLQWSLVIATKILWLLPVIWISLALHKRHLETTAISLIGLCIAMPLEWHVLTGIPRGFVQGISIGLIGIILGLKYLENKKIVFLTLSVGLMFSGILLNPNTLMLLVPVGLWVILKYKLNRTELLVCALSIVPPLLLYFLASNFYKSNPDYVIHTTWNLKISIKTLLENLNNLIYLFKGLFPWLYEAGVAFLALFLILTVVSWRSAESKNRIILGLMWLCLLFTLFVNKVSDGSGSIFFPYVRMYIGMFFWYMVPIMILESRMDKLNKVEVKAKAKAKVKAKANQYILMVSVLSFGLFLAIIQPRMNRIIKTGKGAVDIHPVSQLENDCDKIKILLQNEQKKLLVILGKSDGHNYGCAALSDSVHTFHPDYERRTWIYHKFIHYPSNKCLFMDKDGAIPFAVKKNQIKARLLSQHPYPIWTIDEKNMDIQSLYNKCGWRILGKR